MASATETTPDAGSGSGAGPAPGGWFDADAHVIEPPWIWPEYTRRAFADRIPRLERRGAAEWLVCDGEDLFPVGRLGGLARGERKLRASADDLAGSFEDSIVPGAYSVPERLEAMAADGVSHALVYPTVAMSFFRVGDRALRWELLRAYNRWVADLCAERPDALSSVCVIDPDDPEESLEEIRGARDRGQVAILVPLWAEAAFEYHDPAFDPLWRLAVAEGLPVGFHAFASRAPNPVRQGLDLAVDSVVTRPSAVAAAFAQLIFSGLLERIPGLRWFSAENDAGWCPYFLERAETLFRRSAGAFELARSPSEQFRDQIFVTFTAEKVAVANAARIGTGNLMWGSDYPHNVTTWPGSQELVGGWFEELSTDPAVRDALTRDNARWLFGR